MMVGGQNPVACGSPSQSGCLNRVAFVDIGYLYIDHKAEVAKQ
jgi:hypothetical protein